MDDSLPDEARRLHFFHCAGCQECVHPYEPIGYFSPEAPDDCITCGREHE